jgi:hypothetical protein
MHLDLNKQTSLLNQLSLDLLFGKWLAMVLALVSIFSATPVEAQVKPRILISTDIGGTDPDDFQSMIHALMYADRFQIEGLVSSPFGNGRKKDILSMIDLYEKDYNKLRRHAAGFPDPDALRNVCKQGAISEAPYKGFSTATEGSEWIVSCAKKTSTHPLWVLVWGGIEDVAQALHDAPEIKEKIRVYWIGGPNKKWSVNAYAYLAEHHPDLWIIEANATYRGWFMDADSPEMLTGKAYYGSYIRGKGAMGNDFINYYKGEIKMGDTPSVAYLLNGNPEQPTGESWGGSFVQIDRSSRTKFRGNSTTADTVATYAVLEWHFEGPKLDLSQDSACFTFQTGGQSWPGFYLGDGRYGVRYSPKQAETGTYKTSSKIDELNGHTGSYVSIAPWPGKPGPDDFRIGSNWYGDRPEADLFLGQQQGAATIARHRKAYLLDWAKRWEWLQ